MCRPLCEDGAVPWGPPGRWAGRETGTHTGSARIRPWKHIFSVIFVQYRKFLFVNIKSHWPFTNSTVLSTQSRVIVNFNYLNLHFFKPTKQNFIKETKTNIFIYIFSKWLSCLLFLKFVLLISLVQTNYSCNINAYLARSASMAVSLPPRHRACMKLVHAASRSGGHLYVPWRPTSISSSTVCIQLAPPGLDTDSWQTVYSGIQRTQLPSLFG